MAMGKSNRRSFIKMAAATAVAAPTIALSQRALAQEGEKLSEDDPTAVALGYKENTAEVNGEKYATHTEDQVCTGCTLYQGDDVEWGGCGAFPGKLVAGQGWCQAYAAKPA